MTDQPERPRGGDRQSDDLAPELHNSEQDDGSEQTQTVAEQALTHGSEAFGLEDTEKVTTGEIGGDAQDLVDHMRQMDHGGRIDMDAYRGEPNHDDNVDKYGNQAKVDDLPGDGS